MSMRINCKDAKKGRVINMENLIVSGILVVIIGAIITYLVKQKKKGVKCVGCSHSKQCGGNCKHS